MADLKLILDAVDEIRKTNVNAHDDIRKAITNGIYGVHKDIAASALVTNEKLNGMLAHLAELNGTVASLQKESDNRKVVVDEFHEHLKTGSHKPWQWMKKNWWALLLIFIGAVAIIVGLLDYFGLRQLWEFVKEVR
jgi:hypothetical protein